MILSELLQITLSYQEIILRSEDNEIITKGTAYSLFYDSGYTQSKVISIKGKENILYITISK